MIEGYKKWLGGGLGLLFGGPLGAAAGFILGTVLDGVNLDFFYEQVKAGELEPEALNFRVSLLVLAAAVIKSDGEVAKSQLEYVRKFLVKNFGIAQANASMNYFNQLDKTKISIRQVAISLGRYFDYSTRLELLYFLFGVATADGDLKDQELERLQDIARNLGISDTDFLSIYAMFRTSGNSSENAYKVIGVDPDASEQEIKRAYRKLTLQHHPDRVSQHGADVERSAKEKYQKIVDAYEIIKEQRGIK